MFSVVCLCSSPLVEISSIKRRTNWSSVNRLELPLAEVFIESGPAILCCLSIWLWKAAKVSELGGFGLLESLIEFVCWRSVGDSNWFSCRRAKQSFNSFWTIEQRKNKISWKIHFSVVFLPKPERRIRRWTWCESFLPLTEIDVEFEYWTKWRRVKPNPVVDESFGLLITIRRRCFIVQPISFDEHRSFSSEIFSV